MHITVVPHSPQWAETFRQEAEKIRAVLGPQLVNIFHIGSTAVPGLAAKPIIDMLPVVKNLEALDEKAPAMQALGYEVMGEFGIAHRRYYRKGGNNRTHQAHAFCYSDTHNILRHLAFRDYLCHHPAVCQEYGALKTRLAGQHPQDIEAYSQGKNSFVQQAEQAALRWLWQHHYPAPCR